MAAARKRGLGRGLDALLGDPAAMIQMARQEGELRQLPVEHIEPGRYQPRRHWDEEAMTELTASIRAQGVIQPVVVRPAGEDRFELIAGERRWRAAQLAQLAEIPALVKDVAEDVVPAMALIENIQRQDLTALEEADALQRLIDDFGMTHQQAAEAVGRSRAAVSNLLRLTALAPSIRTCLEKGELEMGHARCLLPLDEVVALPLARKAVALGWSVRELERAVRKVQRGSRPEPDIVSRDPNVDALERELAERLATRVQLVRGRGHRGRLVIHYHSHDELDGILGKLR